MSQSSTAEGGEYRIETDERARQRLEEFSKAHEDDVYVYERKRTGGVETALIVVLITKSPDIIRATADLIRALKGDGRPVTLELPDRTRHKDPTEEELKELLPQTEDENDGV